MASDPAAREEYEAILSGAGDKFDTLKEELGEDAEKIEGFSITLDKDGKVSYAVKLLKDMTENSKADEKQQERLEEKRAEKKKAEKEHLEKVTQKKKETEKIEADSIEELVKAIKERLHPELAETTEEE